MATMILITCPKCKKSANGPAELQGKQIRCKNCKQIFKVASVPAAPTKASTQSAVKTAAAKGKAPAPQAKGAASPSKSAVAQAPPPGEKTVEQILADSGMYGLANVEAARAADKAPEAASTSQPASGKIDFKAYALNDIELTPRCLHCAKELENEDAIVCLNCGYNSQTRQHIRTTRTYEHTGNDKFLWLLPGIICAVLVLVFIGVPVVLWLTLPTPTGDSGEPWWYYWIKAMQWWGTIFSLVAIWLLGKFAVKRLILHPDPPEIVKD